MQSDDERVQRGLDHLRRDWPALAILTVIGAAAWAFVELADEVLEGTTRSFDRTVLLWFRAGEGTSEPLGPPWLEEMMRDFTGLGGIGVLTFVTLAAVGYALLVHRWRVATTVLVSVVGGIVMSTVIKAVLDRARPDIVSHAAEVSTASFPSGHSMMAATVYFTLAALAMQFRRTRRTKAYILGVATVATALVGVSRVYLGVHWPTDVLAGWTVGAGWALLVWFLIEGLQSAEGILHEA